MLHSNRQLKILNYLYPKEKVSESDFKSKFGLSFSDSVIKELIKDKLIHIDSYELNRPKIELTEQGRAFIEERRRELWIRSIATPILVSIATNLVIHGILPLLPQILKWLAKFLENIFS